MFAKTLTLAGLTLLIGAAPMSLNAQMPNGALRGGYWEYRTRAFGLPAGTDNRCLDPQQAWAKFANPCDKNHTCTYPTTEIAAGKARFEGYWTDDKGKRTTVRVNGEYTDTTFTLNARTTSGLPLQATFEAHWVSETCPPGAKGP